MAIHAGNFRSSPLSYFFKYDKEATEEDIKNLVLRINQRMPVRRFETSVYAGIIDTLQFYFIDQEQPVFLQPNEVLTITFEFLRDTRIDVLSPVAFENYAKLYPKVAKKIKESEINLEDFSSDFKVETYQNKYTVLTK